MGYYIIFTLDVPLRQDVMRQVSDKTLRFLLLDTLRGLPTFLMLED